MSQSTSACECSVDDLSDCTGAPPSYCGTSVVSASSGASPPAAAFTAVQEVDRGAPQELELPDTDDDGFDDGARVMRRRSAQRRDAQTRRETGVGGGSPRGARVGGRPRCHSPRGGE